MASTPQVQLLARFQDANANVVDLNLTSYSDAYALQQLCAYNTLDFQLLQGVIQGQNVLLHPPPP
jgi:hypothetical protein